MAELLASIYGTEKDKVNCSFYYKIGACRHGEKCSRKHVKPTFSQTIIMANLYQNPAHDPTCQMTTEQIKQHFDLFFEDMFVELAKYGEIEELNVCDNVGDHLVGNIYVRYRNEEDASRANKDLNNRFYAGRPLYCELSPVTDFREACCRQYEQDECTRGGFCNFMHLKQASRELKRALYNAQREERMLKKRGGGADRESNEREKIPDRVNERLDRALDSGRNHDRPDRSHDRNDRDRNDRDRGREYRDRR